MRWSELEKEDKAALLNAGIAAGIVGYGIAFWDYGQNTPKVSSEDWFGAETDDGGADKLGHAYTAYLAANLLAERYESWGYERGDASGLAAWSSFGAVSIMEVGDAFSDYGFSYEDCVFNVAGSLFAYTRRTLPALEEALDFRVEYFPSRAVRNGDTFDLFTDYSGMRHLLAYRLASVPALKETPLRFLEVHAGYYTRGYSNDDAEYHDHRKRAAYVGIGLDLFEIFRAAGVGSAAGVFRFYQPPYTYLSIESASRRPREEDP